MHHLHVRTRTAVRSISGHKAAICSLDFHRYGDILASGSMDTNLKVLPQIVSDLAKTGGAPLYM